MHDPHGLALNRRDLLKSIGTLSVAGSTTGMFVPIAGAAEAAKEWTGYIRSATTATTCPRAASSSMHAGT